MPTSPISLVTYVALLLPGLAYDVVREWNTPHQRRSPYREGAVVAAVSVVADAAAFIVLAVARHFWPAITPDIGRLIRGDVGYIADHYVLTLGWMYGLIAATTIVAAIVARLRRGVRASTMSAWWAMFEAHGAAARSLEVDKKRRKVRKERRKKPRDPIQVGMVLTDGAFVTGRLWTYSQEADETPDRDILLREPVFYRGPGDDTFTEHFGGACVSASRIVTMFVTHLPHEYWDDELFRTSAAGGAEATEGASAAVEQRVADRSADAPPAPDDAPARAEPDGTPVATNYPEARRSPIQVDRAPGSCQRSPGLPSDIVPPPSDEPAS